MFSELGFLFDGQVYPNNSVITLTDIGNMSSRLALLCLTDNVQCCNSSDPFSGEWYLPSGRQIPTSDTPFSSMRGYSVVSLYHNAATSPTGVFRCEVSDASGTSQSIYVGLYLEGDGKSIYVYID